MFDPGLRYWEDLVQGVRLPHHGYAVVGVGKGLTSQSTVGMPNTHTVGDSIGVVCASV